MKENRRLMDTTKIESDFLSFAFNQIVYDSLDEIISNSILKFLDGLLIKERLLQQTIVYSYINIYVKII